MKTISALLGVAMLVGPSLQHVAIKPPSPDRALTPNSSNAPAGCKLLASDKGFPSNDVWQKAFPNVFKKMKGTEGPDYWIQAKTVKDVQDAVNFARKKNVRLSIITSGHDFGGREGARSGLRLDMAALMEPTVFSNSWKCGDTLKPKTASGKVVNPEDVMACKVPNQTRGLVGRSIPQRQNKWHFFEKKDGQNCDHLIERHLNKRHGPDEDMPMSTAPKGSAAPTTTTGAASSAFSLPPLAEIIPSFNKMTPEKGKQTYARVSAAMYNELFFNQADANGLFNMGAQHGGVSTLGGWMQAGGHNPFTHKYGMQVDQLVEIEVVTADGKFQKVSECQNPELFWALRGGGGSTFGVVTGATLKVHPTIPIVVSRFFVNSTSPALWDAVAYFLQNGAKLRDTYGLQGYFYVYPNGFHSVLHMPDNFATLDNAKKAVEPLMARMEKLAGAKHIEPKYYQYKTYKEWYVAEMGNEEMEEKGTHFLSWYDGSFGDVPAAPDVMMNPMLVLPWALKEQQRAAAAASGGKVKRHGPDGDEAMSKAVRRTQPMGRTYLDSRLLSDKQVNSVSLKELAKAINATMPGIDGNHFRGFLYGGGEQAKPSIDSMGLLPAWRSATYHFIINAVPGNLRHDYDIGPLAKLFPDAGAYVNEASPGEPNWKEVFWGSNYPKLEKLKKKYDPKNVFWCSPCVGADIFTYDDERICKNPKYPQSGPAPQTYRNDKSTAGIASLPGTPGIDNPLMPIIQAFMANKTLPSSMPGSSYFRISMGEGGSVGGKFANGGTDGMSGMSGMSGMGGMGGMHGGM